jgi:hypothetical protein
VNFIRRAQFIESEFDGKAVFKGAKFKLSPRFTAVKFGSVASFASAHFDKRPDFSRAIAKVPNSIHRWPPNWKLEENTPDRETATLVESYQLASPRSGAVEHETEAVV